MKTIRIGWDAPESVITDCYAVLIDGIQVAKTTETECDVPVPDGFDHGKLGVVAVVNGQFSTPCEIWYEVFDLLVGWDDTHNCIIVTLPTVAGRWYALEIKTTGDWQDFATIPGTGQVESVGGGTFKMAVFRAWSK